MIFCIWFGDLAFELQIGGLDEWFAAMLGLGVRFGVDAIDLGCVDGWICSIDDEGRIVCSRC